MSTKVQEQPQTEQSSPVRLPDPARVRKYLADEAARQQREHEFRKRIGVGTDGLTETCRKLVQQGFQFLGWEITTVRIDNTRRPLDGSQRDALPTISHLCEYLTGTANGESWFLCVTDGRKQADYRIGRRLAPGVLDRLSQEK